MGFANILHDIGILYGFRWEGFFFRANQRNKHCKVPTRCYFYGFTVWLMATYFFQHRHINTALPLTVAHRMRRKERVHMGVCTLASHDDLTCSSCVSCQNSRLRHCEAQLNEQETRWMSERNKMKLWEGLELACCVWKRTVYSHSVNSDVDSRKPQKFGHFRLKAKSLQWLELLSLAASFVFTVLLSLITS